MQIIKNTLYIFLFLTVLSSCSEYQKALESNDSTLQYKMATKLYEAKKYSKSLRLFEKITLSYRGKPQMERIDFMKSNAYLNTDQYSLAGYYFDRFTKNYPNSSKKEEAAFLSALAYYKASPRFSIEQTDTKNALSSFQNFINAYPDSKRIPEANKYYQELRKKLEKKAFEIAKTYYKTANYDYRNYKASMVAFDNLLSDYLGTSYKEEALYYKLRASHDFVLKSTNRRKLERIKIAEKAYEKLIKNFPKTKFLDHADKMLSNIQREKKELKKLITKS